MSIYNFLMVTVSLKYTVSIHAVFFISKDAMDPPKLFQTTNFLITSITRSQSKRASWSLQKVSTSRSVNNLSRSTTFAKHRILERIPWTSRFDRCWVRSPSKAFFVAISRTIRSIFPRSVDTGSRSSSTHIRPGVAQGCVHRPPSARLRGRGCSSLGAGCGGGGWTGRQSAELCAHRYTRTTVLASDEPTHPCGTPTPRHRRDDGDHVVPLHSRRGGRVRGQHARASATVAYIRDRHAKTQLHGARRRQRA